MIRLGPPRATRPHLHLGLALLPLLASACAAPGRSLRAGTGSAATGGAPARAPAPGGGEAVAPSVTGTWDWVFRENDESGNLRIEQEEWHLVEHGATSGLIEGYYDRALTLLSLDDHLFRCNQQLGITRFTRVRVTGAKEGRRVHLREVGFDARPGPCDDGARSLNEYSGEVDAATLHLEWAERSGEQTLLRRTAPGGKRLAELVGLEDWPAGLEVAPPVERNAPPVHGVFTWDWRFVDAEGDERREHEEWHLDESDGELRGFYDRRVEHLREGGVYACNRAARYETRVRIDVSGHRTGDSVVLAETGYRADPGPCENGLRRLDTYRGSVGQGRDGEGEIVLAWGGGNQVLRRKREPAPVPASAPTTAPEASQPPRPDAP